jgi:hypothetical protein
MTSKDDADGQDGDERAERAKHGPGSASDRLADALELIAFKLQDWGNWLLGFLR